MVSVPLPPRHLRLSMMLRGISLAAASADIAKVLPQTYVLFRTTMSFVLDRLSWELPFPLTVNLSPFASMVMDTVEPSNDNLLLISCEMPARPFPEDTPIMQSPFGVRKASLVTSIVVGCVALISGCPRNSLTSERMGKILVMDDLLSHS